MTKNILDEGLARTHQVVSQVLHNGCKYDEKFKAEDIYNRLIK